MDSQDGTHTVIHVQSDLIQLNISQQFSMNIMPVSRPQKNMGQAGYIAWHTNSTGPCYSHVPVKEGSMCEHSEYQLTHWLQKLIIAEFATEEYVLGSGGSACEVSNLSLILSYSCTHLQKNKIGTKFDEPEGHNNIPWQSVEQ